MFCDVHHHTTVVETAQLETSFSAKFVYNSYKLVSVLAFVVYSPQKGSFQDLLMLTDFMI